ncbi:hypothetical protein ABT144_30090 [Streptomyces sp. NPDC002039]|uniref:hypothetical protein n=1 Tax=Streptomyces sp. NPDC002039 TaxID=3154660 RepID=UPI00332D0EE6
MAESEETLVIRHVVGRLVKNWQARMDTITAMQCDITKWFNREVWTAAPNDTGYGVTRT